MEPCDGTVTAGLVHLRAAMRLDAGCDPSRDRKLEMDGDHLRLHVRAGLCGKSCDLQYRTHPWRWLNPGALRDSPSLSGAARTGKEGLPGLAPGTRGAHFEKVLSRNPARPQGYQVGYSESKRAVR